MAALVRPALAGVRLVDDDREAAPALLIADLVQDDPVGDHDDRVEDRRVVPAQPDQLVGQPGDRVALALPAECWIR